ncbi:MAG: helix-turn-helix domain-containing protein [Terriglobales bacterium]
MPIREAIRSGRRQNFYTTDNSFIDHYAKELQPTDVAVYHALERYANCHTRSTWVGTAKLADVLNVSQRTIQRSLKALEQLKLIRIVQTSTVKMYFVLPVPPRPKTAATPLFDQLDEEAFFADDTAVASATPESDVSSSVSLMASVVSFGTTTASRARDKYGSAYKEEQDSLNKTQEQDFFKKTSERGNPEKLTTARRIVEILGLAETSLTSALAAVEKKVRSTNLSLDGVLQDIVTEANHARRRGIECDKFLEDFLAQKSAEQVIERLHLPATNSLISTVKAAIKAEASYMGQSIDEVRELIANSAGDDSRRGITIDRFYFENVKWRSNVNTSKAEKRKLDNLAANERARELLRQQRH